MVLAQVPNCAVLKAKLVAYEARLGIGVGDITVEDGDSSVKVKFISCKANKATHQAMLTYQLCGAVGGRDSYACHAG